MALRTLMPVGIVALIAFAGFFWASLLAFASADITALAGRPEVAPDDPWSRLAVIGLMFAFSLLMPLRAHSAWQALRSDQRRLGALQTAARLPVSAFRIAREKPRRNRRKQRPDWYRVWATFEHAGRLYEAPSELLPSDPRDALGLARLRVALHPRDPLESLIADDTLRAPGAAARLWP